MPRPKADRVRMWTTVSPYSRRVITALRDKFSMTEGEVLDWALRELAERQLRSDDLPASDDDDAHAFAA